METKTTENVSNDSECAGFFSPTRLWFKFWLTAESQTPANKSKSKSKEIQANNTLLIYKQRFNAK